MRPAVDHDGAGKRKAGVRELPPTLVLDMRGTRSWVAPSSATAADVVAAVR